MSSSEAHQEHEHPWYLAHHFDNIKVQNYAVRMGMWLFLGTEVLLFAGLFLGYTVYRYFYPQAFEECSQLLSVGMGAFNTVVLIGSSFLVVWAYHSIKHDQVKKCAWLLFLTIVCAGIFLVVKYFEYMHKIHEGQLPGKMYTFEGVTAPGANMYFSIYFLMTGLHALHVIIGATILAVLMVRVMKGKYGSHHNVPIELGGLYWHLVDLVWIFLFPLLYLI